MAVKIAEGYVEITTRFRPSDINRQATRAGTHFGRRFSAAFARSAKLNFATRGLDAKATKAGYSAGRAFSRGFRAGTKNLANSVVFRGGAKQGEAAGRATGKGFQRGFSRSTRNISVQPITTRTIRDSERMGDRSGRSFMGRLAGGIARMTGAVVGTFSHGMGKLVSSSPYIAAGVLAVFAAMAPAIGAALATGITLAFGGGIAALGIIAAAQSKRVKSAFSDMASTITSDFKRMARPLEGTLVNVAGDILKVHKALKGPLTQAFKSMAPVLSGFSEHISDAFAGWGPVISAATRAFNGLLRVLGPMLKKELSLLGDALTELFNFVAANPRPFAAIVGGIFRMVTWSVKLITWLSKAHVAIVNFFSAFRRAGEASGTFSRIGKAARQLWGSLSVAFGHIKKAVSDTFRTLAPIGNAIKRALASPGLASFIRNTWSQILSIIRLAGELIGAAVRGIANIIMWTWRRFGSQITTFFRGIFQVVGGFVRGGLTMIRGALNLLIAVFTGDWGRAWNALKQIARGAVTAVTRIVRGLVSIIRAIGGVIGKVVMAWVRMVSHYGRSIAGAVGRFFGSMRTRAVNAAKGLWRGVSNWFSRARNAAGRIFGGLGKFMRRVWNSIRNTVTRIARGIRNGIVNWFQRARNAGGRVWNGLAKATRRIFNGIRGTVTRVARGVRNGIVNWFQRARNAAGRIWGGLSKATRRVWNSIRNAVTRIARGIRNAAVNWFNRARNAAGRIWTGLRKLTSRIWTGIRNTVTRVARGVRNAVVNWFNRARNAGARAWNSLKKACQRIWVSIRNTISRFARAIRNAVVNWATRARNAATRIWTNFRRAATRIWQNLRRSIGNIARAIRNIAVNWFNRLRNAGQRTFNRFRNAASRIWNSLRKSIGNIVRSIRNVAMKWFNRLRNQAVRLFNNFKKGASNVWKSIKNNITDKARQIKNGVIDTFKTLKNRAIDIFKNAKDGIGRVWNQVKDKAKAPVKFMVHTVYNDGLLNMYRKIRAVVPALPEMKKVQLSKSWFAKGGIMPGYTPGRDVHTVPGPNGPVGLSGGEAIMRPEWTRAIGAAGVHAMNKMARTKGSAGIRSAMGLQGNKHPEHKSPKKSFGGNPKKVPETAQKFALGGILNGVREFVGRKKDDLLGKLADFGMRALNPLRDKLKNAWGPGAIPNIPYHAMGVINDALKTFLQGQDDAHNGGGGWTNARGNLAKAVSWAKSQHGKRYQWGGNGNPSWDCSGYLSAIESVIRGQRPHRRWSTHVFRGKEGAPGWIKNLASPFELGVTHAGVGHTAGTLMGNKVESSGSGGVKFNRGARGAGDKMFRARYGFKPARKMAKATGGGGGKAVFTSFWDPMTASGIPMNKRTIASSYLPLGTHLRVNIGGKTANGIVQDLGPAKFVYARHPGKAVLDLNTKMMKSLTGRAYNTATGNFTITKRGKGRTLYGTRWRGYQDGGIMSGSHDIGGMLPDKGIAYNRSGHPEFVATLRQMQGLVNAAQKGGDTVIHNLHIDVQNMDDVETLKKLLGGLRRTARANGSKNRRTR